MKALPAVQDPADVFQRQTRDFLADLLTTPLIQGVLVRDVQLVGTATRVYHNLRRPAIGFLVVDATTAVDVYRDEDVTASDRFLPLRSSVDATVSLWIF